MDQFTHCDDRLAQLVPSEIRYEIPPVDLIIDWSSIPSHPVRECYPAPTAAQYGRLRSSLAAKGQLRPLLVRCRSDGTYELLDGGQRICPEPSSFVEP